LKSSRLAASPCGCTYQARACANRAAPACGTASIAQHFNPVPSQWRVAHSVSRPRHHWPRQRAPCR
jgi:hypothetical protein